MSPNCQARIIGKWKDGIQLLRAVDELCVRAYVGPDAMGDSVDDYETMFN